MKSVLTAIEINNSKKNIQAEIDRSVFTFNKTRLNRKLGLSGKNKLTKEEQEALIKELINDEESQNYRRTQTEFITKEKDNYTNLRYIIHGLNDMDEYAIFMEEFGIQKLNNFLTYEKLVTISYTKLLMQLLDEKRTKIKKYNGDSDIISELSINNQTDIDLLIRMRNMYKLSNTVDPLELWEKFEMENNIDVSHKLSEYYFYHNDDNNLINEFNAKSLLDGIIKMKIISNKMLATLLSNRFVSTNKVTCYHNTYSTDENNTNMFTTRTIGELLLEITNDDNFNLEKVNRQQIYMVYDGTRPSGDEYYKWNGLQIFDIDLKLWETDKYLELKQDIAIQILKEKLFKELSEFNWFLWICKSPSSKGLHIYTKVTPPHHVYINITENEYISKYWYSVNYETKLSNIYDIINRMKYDNKPLFEPQYFNDNFELKFVDNSVGRITSGIRLTYDPNPLINHNFVDLHPGVNLNQTNDGYDSQYTIKRIMLRDTKIAIKYRDRINNLVVGENPIEEIAEKNNLSVDLSKFVTLGIDINEIRPLPRNNINYVVRWNVCNTLASIFGKDGLTVAHIMLDSTLCNNVNEINSFYSCALTNQKEPTKLGIDLLTRVGLIKAVEPELKTIIDSNFKNDLKLTIERVINNPFVKPTIELSDNEYLSDRKDFLLNPKKGGLTNSKLNIILSPPNTGKTTFIKVLAKQDKKRVMLVLPYISVIKNKIEKEPDIMEMFACYYGDRDIKDMEYGINVVTTFDKFARCNYEKVSKMFDYIFIDESHLLFTSSYRIEATSNVIKKIKELIYISQNDRLSAKLCLLTGTETGESYFFGKFANLIKISKKSLQKDMEFLIGDNSLDCITRMVDKAHQLLSEGYKLLIPTNKGEIYTEKLIGMIEFMLNRTVKYGYYKRSNTEQEICRLINEKATVGDYDIIFCSNYLSVGVDINDREKFASIYFGNFSGYEIEQFNARFRKVGIRSVYVVQTENADGEINNVLLEEPNLVLHLTEEDVSHFNDDKVIASAKQEFLAEYDPVLQKITTPGFSYINGKIQFNVEEYELTSFESKYSECMEHPVKVARELFKYGYNITVCTEYVGMDDIKQNELKKVGLESARNEKLRKHSLMVGTFIELIEKNCYTNSLGLEYKNLIDWIGKSPECIFEDRSIDSFLIAKYNVFATPISLTVKSKEALEQIYKQAKYLITKYSQQKCIDIINQYVDEHGILKQKNFKRAINLLKLMDSSDANELTDPLTRTLEKMYDFIDKFELDKNYRISHNTYRATLAEFTNNYIDLLGIRISTPYAYEKIEDSVSEILQDLATKSTSKNGIRFDYNKLPDTDSVTLLNRKTIDSMVERMFKISTETIRNSKRLDLKQKHITLISQGY